MAAEFKSDNKNISTAVVTGASSGIGEAITLSLLALKTYRVVMIALSGDGEIMAMEAIKKHCISKYGIKDDQVLIIGTDLSKPELVVSKVIPAIKEYTKSINLLVNSAGAYLPQAKGDKHLENFTYSLNLHVTAPYVLMKYLQPLLAEGGKTKLGGNVVNIGSIAAAYADGGAYSVSKAALRSLTKTMAFELASDNIRVNTIELQIVLGTNVFAKLPKEQVDFFIPFTKSVTPLGRLGRTSDVVKMCSFLMDNEKSGWITGQSILIDGGLSLPLIHVPKKEDPPKQE